MNELIEHLGPALEQLPAVALLVFGIRHEFSRLTAAVERLTEVCEAHEARLDAIDGGGLKGA